MRHVTLCGVVLFSIACGGGDPPPAAPAKPAATITAPASAPVSAPAAPSAANPLLPKWTGPYGGVPPFAKVKVEHFKPALEAGMEEYRREITAIADSSASHHSLVRSAAVTAAIQGRIACR